MGSPSAEPFEGDTESWRERLSLRLARGFFLVFVTSAVLMAASLRGSSSRWFMTCVALHGVLALGWPALTGRPRGHLRAWLLVVPCLNSAMCSLAMFGFLAAPGVIMALTLMLSGILLGRRVMWSLGALCVVAVSMIAWCMATGRLAPPPAADTAFTSGRVWLRTMGVSFMSTALFGTLIVAVIDRMERSLDFARAEMARREQAERERAEARQLETVGRLAAGIAHDFNNNLTAIIGCAEMLQNELAGNTKQGLANIIVESSRRAAELTGQLLAYSRQAQMILVPVDVHGSLRAAAQLLERSMDPSVELVLRLEASRAIVDADATLLQNALLNLLVNARDAMPQGGRLVVVTASGVEHLDIAIKDTGIGIDDDALPRIFDPFFTTKPLGTGLGLAAVAGTAQSLGGTVSVETQLGHGSVFRMRLPLSIAPQPSVREERQGTVGQGKILIVDDQPLVLRTASAVLVRLGYDVVAVTSGRDAVELVGGAPGQFDLVLLDLRMPGMSGEATFDALIHIEPSIRVLVWSGYGAEQDLPEMLRRGAVGFLPKPYGVVDLSNMVARVIRPIEERPLA